MWERASGGTRGRGRAGRRAGRLRGGSRGLALLKYWSAGAADNCVGEGLKLRSDATDAVRCRVGGGQGERGGPGMTDRPREGGPGQPRLDDVMFSFAQHFWTDYWANYVCINARRKSIATWTWDNGS